MGFIVFYMLVAVMAVAIFVIIMPHFSKIGSKVIKHLNKSIKGEDKSDE